MKRFLVKKDSEESFDEESGFSDGKKLKFKPEDSFDEDNEESSLSDGKKLKSKPEESFDEENEESGLSDGKKLEFKPEYTDEWPEKSFDEENEERGLFDGKKLEFGRHRFKPEYTNEWPAIIESKKSTKRAFCKTCSRDFFISECGRYDIRCHLRSELHKINVANKVSRAELLYTAFLVQHNLKMSSPEEDGDFFRAMFPDSEIAVNYGCSNTKTSAILKTLTASIQEDMDNASRAAGSDEEVEHSHSDAEENHGSESEKESVHSDNDAKRSESERSAHSDAEKSSGESEKEATQSAQDSDSD